MPFLRSKAPHSMNTPSHEFIMIPAGSFLIPTNPARSFRARVVHCERGDRHDFPTWCIMEIVAEDGSIRQHSDWNGKLVPKHAYYHLRALGNGLFEQWEEQLEFRQWKLASAAEGAPIGSQLKLLEGC